MWYFIIISGKNMAENIIAVSSLDWPNHWGLPHIFLWCFSPLIDHSVLHSTIMPSPIFSLSMHQFICHTSEYIGGKPDFSILLSALPPTSCTIGGGDQTNDIPVYRWLPVFNYLILHCFQVNWSNSHRFNHENMLQSPGEMVKLSVLIYMAIYVQSKSMRLIFVNLCVLWVSLIY